MTTKEKKRILFLGHSLVRMPDLILFAEQLREMDSSFDISFLLRRPTYSERYPKVKLFDIVELASDGADSVQPLPRDASLISRIFARIMTGIRRLVMEHCPKSSLAEWVIMSDRKKHYRREHHFATTISRSEHRFDILVSAVDSSGGQDGVIGYIKGFKDAQVPIFVINIVNPPGTWILPGRRNNPLYELSPSSPWLLHWVARRFPGQVLDYEGKKYTYTRAGEVLALHQCKMLTDKPYISGHGFADFVAADSQYDYQDRVKQGVSKDKLRIVGDYSFDANWRIFNERVERRAKAVEEYGLNPDKKIILLALPQLAEHGYLGWDEHFEYINTITKLVCAGGANVLIGLHPKMDPVRYAYLESEFPCRILTSRLFDYLAIADVFLSKPSSVVRWGVLCDVDVILFDFWGYSVEEYEYMDCIDIVQTMEALERTITLRMETPQDRKATFDKLSRNQVFDGNVMRRYADWINEVIDKRRP